MQDLLVAFQQVLQPGVLLYLILGTTLGLVVGTLPGLTATMAVAIHSSYFLASSSKWSGEY